MDMDFEEQLGLEEDHPDGFEDDIFVEPLEEFEPIAERVMLPVQVNPEDDLMETTDGASSAGEPIASCGDGYC